jgi:hypothetical protein
VNVSVAIRVPVMVTVVRRPPEHALLTRTLCKTGEHELPKAVQHERAMTEIPVVSGRNSKHPKKVRPCQPYEVDGSEWSRQRQQNGEMKQEEGQTRETVVLPSLEGKLSHSDPVSQTRECVVYRPAARWAEVILSDVV